MHMLRRPRMQPGAGQPVSRRAIDAPARQVRDAPGDRHSPLRLNDGKNRATSMATLQLLSNFHFNVHCYYDYGLIIINRLETFRHGRLR